MFTTERVPLVDPASGGMTEQHFLYLISRSKPPLVLAATRAGRTTQALVVVATLDLNRDHRVELVLATTDCSAPIGTALFELQQDVAACPALHRRFTRSILIAAVARQRMRIGHSKARFLRVSG